jgi:hypothetical protein
MEGPSGADVLVEGAEPHIRALDGAYGVLGQAVVL